MFELNQIRQFVKVAECGTLSGAAEVLSITQPALSRSMRSLEDALSVPLFDRATNKITLNENGAEFYREATALLAKSEEAVSRIRAFDKSHRSIAVGSCSPSPLIAGFTSLLTRHFPDSPITTEVLPAPSLLEKLKDGTFRLVILPATADDEGIISKPFLRENLCAYVDASSELAKKDVLRFSDLDGKTVMLMPLDGVWNDFIRKKVNAARFISQLGVENYTEVMRSSTLISFITDLVLPAAPRIEGKAAVPILDDEASVTYTCACRKRDEAMFAEFFAELEQNDWRRK